MKATYERVQFLIRPDQKKEIARRARETKASMAEVTRLILDKGIQLTREDEEVAKTLAFLKKAAEHRKAMPVVDIDMADFINQMREEEHD